MLQFCETLYPVTDYAYTTIPTYPSGQIGFVLCSKNPVSFLYPLLFGLQCEKTSLWRFANNTGADQPAHTRSLISIFVIRF